MSTSGASKNRKYIQEFDSQLVLAEPRKKGVILKRPAGQQAVQVASNEVIAIFGIRGYGKSFFLKNAVLPHLRRVVVYDHVLGYPDDGVMPGKKGEVKGYPNWRITSDLRQLVDWMLESLEKKNRRKRYFLVYRPRMFTLQDFDFFCKAVYVCGSYYFILDEMADVTSPHTITDYHGELLRKGRHMGIGYCGITQRPAAVHNMYKSQVVKGFAFRLNLPADVRAMVDWWGPEAAAIRSLPHFHYLLWDGDRLYKMKPLKEKDELIEIEDKPAFAVKETKESEAEQAKLYEEIEVIEEEYE